MGKCRFSLCIKLFLVELTGHDLCIWLPGRFEVVRIGVICGVSHRGIGPGGAIYNYQAKGARGGGPGAWNQHDAFS